MVEGVHFLGWLSGVWEHRGIDWGFLKVKILSFLACFNNNWDCLLGIIHIGTAVYTFPLAWMMLSSCYYGIVGAMVCEGAISCLFVGLDLFVNCDR